MKCLSSYFAEFCLRSSILLYYDIQIVAVDFSPLSLCYYIASNSILNYYISQIKVFKNVRIWGYFIINYTFTIYRILLI